MLPAAVLPILEAEGARSWILYPKLLRGLRRIYVIIQRSLIRFASYLGVLGVLAVQSSSSFLFGLDFWLRPWLL